MSFREKLFIDALYRDGKKTLSKILSTRRKTFIGATPLLVRTRKYKYAGEVRTERVRVVKPPLVHVKLHSLLLAKAVPLQTTTHMLKYIEACGGLDDYLLKTPDRELFSDAASTLKMQISKLHRAAKQSAQLQPSTSAEAEKPAALGRGGSSSTPRLQNNSLNSRGLHTLAACSQGLQELLSMKTEVEKERVQRSLAMLAMAAGQ